MYSDGKFAYGEQRDIDVWPAENLWPEYEKTNPSIRKALLFDPSGKTAVAIKTARFSWAGFEKMDSIGDVSRPVGGLFLFVIGEDALTDTRPADVAKLESFVSDGACVS